VTPLASFVHVAGPDLIVLALITLFIGLPIAIAVALNHRFQQRNPAKRPYRWGYYFATQCFVGGIALGFALERGPVGVVISAALYGILAWFFAQRAHWAWITLTVLSFNPVAWVINIVYLSKRWSEDALQPQTI
jgi:hypothetical protein